MEPYELYTRRKAQTRMFTAENPTGQRGGGSQGQDWEKVRPCIALTPGEECVLAEVRGSGLINCMWFTGDVSQSLILRIWWEDQPHPAVEAPLGSFFGYGFPGLTADKEGKFPLLNSAMLLAAPCRGLNSYWPMPFRTYCRVTLANRQPQGCEPLTVYYAVTVEEREMPEDILYFHASYRQAVPVERNRAYTVIDGIQGEGRFAGVSMAASVNAPNGCWVEGEAKMYVDGDTRPTLNYTGTEDYFSGAYAFGYDRGAAKSRYQPYSGLYAGMYAAFGNERDAYQYQPQFLLYRLHIPDPVHFQRSFRMTLQDIMFSPHGSVSRHDDFSSCAYWYQTLPSAPLAALPTDRDMLIG